MSSDSSDGLELASRQKLVFGGFWDGFSQLWDGLDDKLPGVAEDQGPTSLSTSTSVSSSNSMSSTSKTLCTTSKAVSIFFGSKEEKVVQNVVLVEDTQEDDGAEADVESDNNESDVPRKKRRRLSPGRCKSYDPDSTLSEYSQISEDEHSLCKSCTCNKVFANMQTQTDI